MKRMVLLLSVLLLWLAAGPVAAEQSVKTGKYEVHYNAFLSTFLSPEVAKAYQIGRSKNKAVLNVAVLDVSGDKPKAVEADIHMRIRNAYGQEKNVKPFKVVEPGETDGDEAIYYLTTFKVSNREQVNFHIQVKPRGEERPIDIKFSKEFFTE
jgi:hypothetical protein